MQWLPISLFLFTFSLPIIYYGVLGGSVSLRKSDYAVTLFTITLLRSSARFGKFSRVSAWAFVVFMAGVAANWMLLCILPQPLGGRILIAKEACFYAGLAIIFLSPVFRRFRRFANTAFAK